MLGGLGLRVQGSGFRVFGLGFKVLGLAIVSPASPYLNPKP